MSRYLGQYISDIRWPLSFISEFVREKTDAEMSQTILSNFDLPVGADGSVKAKCNHCSAVISGHTRITSNFVKHLKV